MSAVRAALELAAGLPMHADSLPPSGVNDHEAELPVPEPQVVAATVRKVEP